MSGRGTNQVRSFRPGATLYAGIAVFIVAAGVAVGLLVAGGGSPQFGHEVTNVSPSDDAGPVPTLGAGKPIPTLETTQAPVESAGEGASENGVLISPELEAPSSEGSSGSGSSTPKNEVTVAPNG